jgi:hypothetical protein
MQSTIPGTGASNSPTMSPRPASQSSRVRALGWLRTVGAVWGLATVLVLGLSLFSQLGAERDWVGRTVVLLLLGGQACLAALQISRWRPRSRA